MPERRWRVLVCLGLALGVLSVQAPIAGAAVRPGPPPGGATVRGNTEMTMSGTGHGTGVTGFLATDSSTFDPVTDPYPAGSPGNAPDGFVPWDEGFAGVIYGTPKNGPVDSLHLYCIDIRTYTWSGLGYVLGSWSASGVPRVGYVAQILDKYYPNTDEPSTLTNLDQKAAAVQAAIWFFSDRYALSTTDPLYSAVVKIVHDVKLLGPLVEPPPPSLTITPTALSGARNVLGPYTVTTDHPPATVQAVGANMYSDRAGTTQIHDGDSVPSGTKIWLRPVAGSRNAVLQATSEATVPSGNVYLYDGYSEPRDAQRLILAENATLRTTVRATAEFLPYGSLVVSKRIAGPAAGSQGRVVIRVRCDDNVRRRPFVIQAGAGRGTSSRTYHHIQAGTTCTVIETRNGSNTATWVRVIGDGQTPTITEGQTATVRITDIYRFVPGSLLERKTIAGPAAGQEGQITIHTVCNGRALTPDFVIAAGTPASEQTRQYDRIHVPAKCTVTETADGHTSAVSVVVEGSGQTISVPAGAVANADISDTYGLVPGQLAVTKTIDGPAAGQQGAVTIHTVCNGTALTPDFVIPAGTPAGVQSQIYSGLAAGESCVVTETADGHTSAVSAVVAGSPQTTTIPAGAGAAATITDTYGLIPGSLLVTKAIAGSLAGTQGPVTIHVVCDGVALSPDFVIAAGTAAGSASHSFDDIPAGSVCTVTETSDGATATVTATVSGDDQTVTVPAGKVVAVSLSDVYDNAVQTENVENANDVLDVTLGTLTVTKTITGPAARHHGRIEILVACGGPANTFVFVIPTRFGRGSVTRSFSNIPAGARCKVTEPANGHTGTIAVAASGGRTVNIHANRRATVHLTDTFSVRAAAAPAPAVTG